MDSFTVLDQRYTLLAACPSSWRFHKSPREAGSPPRYHYSCNIRDIRLWRRDRDNQRRNFSTPAEFEYKSPPISAGDDHTSSINRVTRVPRAAGIVNRRLLRMFEYKNLFLFFSFRFQLIVERLSGFFLLKISCL